MTAHAKGSGVFNCKINTDISMTASPLPRACPLTETVQGHIDTFSTDGTYPMVNN